MYMLLIVYSLLYQALQPSPDCLGRGKMSIAVNLKRKEGADVVKKLCNNADVLIEPFRVGQFIKLHHHHCVIYFISVYTAHQSPKFRAIMIKFSTIVLRLGASVSILSSGVWSCE